MTFCKNCGTQVNDGVKYCPRCGSMIQPASSGGHSPSGSGFFHSPEMDDGGSSPNYGYSNPGSRYPDHGYSSPGGGYSDPGYPNPGGGYSDPGYGADRGGYPAPRGYDGSGGSYPARPAPAYSPDPGPVHRDYEGVGESYFDGDGFELLGYHILLALVSMVTCGIAAPWMLVKIYRWRISHTVIDGKRQCFNGTGGQLFGSWIKWWLLTLVTCGLYGFYLPVALQKWETSHTSYEGSSEAYSAVYENSWFEGTFGGFIGNYILCNLLTLVTCGIAYPWGATMIIRWTTEGERVDGDRYYYTGSGGGLFGEYIIGFLLSLVTCGIYSSWATCRVNRYVIKNTHIAR